jgi:hypothetical protein
MKRYLLAASALALTFGESLPTGLRCFGIALGVMATSYNSAHAAAPVLATGNWSEFGFVPRGGRYNPDETILTTTNVGALTVLWSAQDGSFPFTSFCSYQRRCLYWNECILGDNRQALMGHGFRRGLPGGQQGQGLH